MFPVDCRSFFELEEPLVKLDQRTIPTVSIVDEDFIASFDDEVLTVK